MDTFSSSVKSLTTLLPPRAHHHPTTPRLLYYYYHFKNSNTTTSSPSTTSNKLLTPNFTSTSSRSFSTNITVQFVASSHGHDTKSSPSFKQLGGPSVHHHHKAASGYAAALLDVARCNHSLEAVEKDVRRLSKYWRRNQQLRAFMSDPLLEDSKKGQVVKDVAEKGRFHRHLVVLLKLLVEKNKVGIVGDVLHEFERIYQDELTPRNRSPWSPSPVVLV